MTRAAVIALGRPTFDLELGATMVDEAWGLLKRLDIDVVGSPDVVVDSAHLGPALARIADGAHDLVIVLQATFCDASSVIEIASSTDEPILVWSFPEERTGKRLRLNSLCGANLAAYSLRRRHRAVEFVHVDPRRGDAPARVRTAVERTIESPTVVPAPPAYVDANEITPEADAEAERVATAMAGLTIGIIGRAPDGFEPCEADDAEVDSICGVAVDRIGLDDLFHEADRVGATEQRATAQRVDDSMTITPEVASSGLERSLRLYGGLRHLATERSWSALATRCWPECMTDYGGAICTPSAMMNEDGVPAVCEADLMGAITGLLLREVAGEPPYIADLVDIDENDDTSVVWHCGVAPTTMADPDHEPEGARHPNRHVALVNQFALKTGRVTIARLSQAGGEVSLVVGGGEMLRRSRPYTGTCGVVRWDLPVRDVATSVFGHGLEHHVGVVYGDHRDTLVALAHRWGIPVIRLGHDDG